MLTTMSNYRSLIHAIMLNQRAVLSDFRKQTQLAKFDIEILCFANVDNVFNTYQIRQFFNNTAPQQIYRSIKKLIGLNLIEVLQMGRKGKPTCYIATKKGEKYLHDYFKAFENALNFATGE